MRRCELQRWVVGLVLGASACSPSEDPNGEPQATETEGDGDEDGEGDGDGEGEGDSGDGDGEGDGDDGDDEPECTEPGQWVVADPGECRAIADALRKVDPPPPHNYVEEERGYIAIDGAGKAHIVTQRVHFKDVQGDNLETGEHVDTRIIYRTNESGAWVEKVLAAHTSVNPWGLSVTADGDVTLVNEDAIFVRIDGKWSVRTFPGHWLPTERTVAFDPVSNFVYVQMQTVADGFFVLGGPPDCLQRILEVPDGCEPELELVAADGKPGTLDLLARGPSDHDTGFRELAHLHYEAGTLEQQILTARHTDTFYGTLAVQSDGTLHTCTEVSYEHGHDADSWISVDWQQPGFNVWPEHCQVATTDAGDTWMTYKAFKANADGDPSYIGHIVDGHVELEVMGTVSNESSLSARSIALGPDGEPHVLAQHGVGHRYFFRENGEWTSIDFFL